VVSELVTNSVQAAQAVSYPVPSEIWLRLSPAQADILVEVGDHAPGWPRLSGPPGSDEERGRGLILVAAMSEEWGCRQAASGQPGKITWARVRRREPVLPATETPRGQPA
jgi:hypothetical protein